MEGEGWRVKDGELGGECRWSEEPGWWLSKGGERRQRVEGCRQCALVEGGGWSGGKDGRRGWGRAGRQAELVTRQRGDNELQRSWVGVRHRCSMARQASSC